MKKRGAASTLVKQRKEGGRQRAGDGDTDRQGGEEEGGRE